MPTNLDRYFPFDAGAGSSVLEVDWRRMARQWIGSGPLLLEDNGMLVYADSSGMQIKVKTGKCFVAGHYGEITSEKILPIGAASANNRIDLVVLRCDFVNNLIVVDVVAGTPAATPVAPTVVQSSSIWEIALAQVSVLTTDVTVAAGRVTDVRSQIQNPAVPAPWIRVFGGIGYKNSWIANTAPGDVYYKRVADFTVLRGSTKNGATGTVAFTLPVGYRPPVQRIMLSADLTGVAAIIVDPTGDVTISQLTGSVSSVTYLDNIRIDCA